MAPSAVDVVVPTPVPDNTLKHKALPIRQPLKASGALDKYASEDVTPVIGTEFPEANLVEWLQSPNADELLRDLAIKSKAIRAYLRITKT